MNGCCDTREERALELLLAHSASLELTTWTARERLDLAVGPALARRLVSALCATGPFRLERYEP